MSRTLLQPLLVLLALGLVACESEDPAGGGAGGLDLGPADLGAPDLGPADQGPTDLGPSDQGPGDLGPDDLGPQDQGPDDQGPDDQGPGEDLGPDDGFAERMALGKQWLAQAEPRFALRAFEEALALRPSSSDAAFGAALAQAIDAVELTSMLFGVLGPLTGFEVTRDEFFAESIHGELMKLRAEYLRALELAAQVDPDRLDFTVEGAWLYLNLRPILVWRGRFDGGDVHLMRASLSMILALLDSFTGQDLSGPLLDTINAVRRGQPSLDLPTIGALLGLLIQGEPGTFFALHAEDGAALFAETRDLLAAVGRELNLAVRWMEAHPAPEGSLQVTELRPDPVREGQLLVLRNALRPGDEGPTEVELQTSLTPALLDAFGHASAALGQPGDLVLFREEVLPMLSVLLHLAVQFGMLDGLGASLPFDLRVLDRPALQQLLDSFLPLPAALDFGTFYAQPVGLRVVLPEFAEESPPRFVAEWECPDDLGASGFPSAGRGLLCGAAAALTDAAHFTERPEAFAADGWAARTPYFVWADPTFNGLLHVDPAQLQLPEAPAGGYQPADLRTLNALLAARLTNLLSLLGQAL